MTGPLVLRCDGSARVGLGHLVRCLALAQGLGKLGHKSWFLTAARDMVLLERLRGAGCAVLPAAEGLSAAADARKTADMMNLDNPERKKMRALAASLVAEAWARTGKSKDALVLLDTIELPKENREQIDMQVRVARVFAKFVANQRGQARTEPTSTCTNGVPEVG